MNNLEQASPEPYHVLSSGLSNLDDDSAFWWQTTGLSLAHLMEQAGYSIHDQYACLLFYRSKIIPALGEQPLPNGTPRRWPSYTTDDFSPIEYSWSWDGAGHSPRIRFAIEPIGPRTGTVEDPFNKSKSEDLMATLCGTSTALDLELFHHFWRYLLASSDDTELIDERASPNSHRSSIFIACELGGNRLKVKAYFMPMLRSLEINQSRAQVTVRAITTLSLQNTETRYPALDTLVDFLETDPIGSQTEIEMISVDCEDPKVARIKIYLRHPQTSWEAICKVMTLNGRIDVSSENLQELWQFWRSVLSLKDNVSTSTELPKVEHSTAGIFYCFLAGAGDVALTPKLYVPAKHYGQNDQAIVNGLARYFQDRGQDHYIDNYRKVLTQISHHRALESQRGLHTYIACRFKTKGLSVTSYISPEIYHPARWSCQAYPDRPDDYVFGRDYSASARLNYQHALLKQHHGFLLHPSISQEIHKARIADIGTGTGVWPLQASRSFPNAQFDGFDISPAQYPPEAWLPDNVRLHVQDAYTQFPADMLEVFDVVHIQKLITIIYDNDPTALIKNILPLLKPGGYIQWNEIDPASASVDASAKAERRAMATEGMLKFMTSPEVARSMAWISNLDKILLEQGFESVVYERAPIALEERAAWNISFLLTYEDAMIQAKGTDRGTLRNELEKLYEEFHQGAFIQPEIIVAVGRKS
ncbi:hypothetical protein ACLMJK_000021 [Lecanora helva]